MPDRPRRYQRLFAELKRRKVFRVVAVYGAVAFGVIQVVEPVASAYDLPGWFLPGIVTLLLVGFPFAVILAWALEMTPEGVRRTDSAEPEEIERIVAQPRAKRWLSGILALVGLGALLAGAWFAGRRSVDAAARPAGPAAASIAVLPFADMSPEGDQEYFADGVSEELLNLLAGVRELRVAARTSSFAFKGEEVGIDSIARALNVAHVLEGSVRKAGEEVRVTTQLIRAEDGYHVWSDTWDRRLDDIFAIQDEIAADVVDQLRVQLLGETPTVEETDPEAYSLTLRARHLSRQVTPESVQSAEKLFREALAIDPEYAAAWSGLASNEIRLGQLTGAVEEGNRAAQEAALRALEIDEDDANAHSALGRLAMNELDFVAAARHQERALAVEPGNTRIVGHAASLLSMLGRFDESIALYERITRRDPLNISARFNLGFAYYAAGRTDDAAQSVRTVLELNPSAGIARTLLGLALLQDGRAEAALERIEEESVEWARLMGLVEAYHALGRTEASDSALAELIEGYERTSPFTIAVVLAYRGETDRAFTWLDRAAGNEDPGLSEIHAYPELYALEDDPRWPAFLEGIGMSREQLDRIELDVELPGD